MIDHVSEFLEIGGVPRDSMSLASDDMRLLQDLGLVGDSAYEGFEYLQGDAGVDLSGFIFGDFFPSEMSNAALMLRWASTRRSRIGRYYGSRFEVVTVADVRRIVAARSWSVFEEQRTRCRHRSDQEL